MATSKISLYFLGTDAFATVILRRLALDSAFDVRGVVVPPDRPSGRGQPLAACPVKIEAETFGLPIFYDACDLLEKEANFFVVASYGHLLSRAVLAIPRTACVNIHCSMLPRYRGAAPIQAALLNGDRVTGVSVQHMVPQLDAGPVYAFSEVAIREDHDAATLRAEMALLGAELLAQSLSGIRDGSIEALAQDESAASYASKIHRHSGRMDWSRQSALQIHRALRAYTPWPGIFTSFKGKSLKIADAHVAEGTGLPGRVVRVEGAVGVFAREGMLILERVQLEGKKEMPAPLFARGYPDFVGATLG